MGHREYLYALALNAVLFLAHALPSAPIATDPILVTATVSTVLPSLVTLYSVVPATDAAPGSVATVTTTIDGTLTTVTSTAVIAGSVTSTIISTVSLTTNQVVVSTVGFSTVYGPDPTTSAVAASTPSAVPSSSATAPGSSTSSTSSLSSQSSSLAAVSTSTSTQSGGFSSPSTAVGANGSSSASLSSHSKGLSTGAKAGIGVGVVLGVVILALLFFFLGQRYSRRRSNRAQIEADSLPVAENDDFRAGRPYESTGSRDAAPVFITGKGHAYSTNTTVAGSDSPSVSGKSCDLPHSSPMSNPHDHSELSALPQITKEDDQMYVGVPAHMSGSKRWSMKEFMK
jgi:hypothetical protein